MTVDQSDPLDRTMDASRNESFTSINPHNPLQNNRDKRERAENDDANFSYHLDESKQSMFYN